MYILNTSWNVWHWLSGFVHPKELGFVPFIILLWQCLADWNCNNWCIDVWVLQITAQYLTCSSECGNKNQSVFHYWDHSSFCTRSLTSFNIGVRFFQMKCTQVWLAEHKPKEHEKEIASMIYSLPTKAI